MRILGHGVDLVVVARLARSIDEQGERFLARVFTDGERACADALPRRRLERLAARFAAKEAALKALGTGWRSGIAWTDIEVVSEASGAPSLRVSGRASEIAAERGVTAWLVSLSHTSEHALASVLALGGANDAADAPSAP